MPGFPKEAPDTVRQCYYNASRGSRQLEIFMRIEKENNSLQISDFKKGDTILTCGHVVQVQKIDKEHGFVFGRGFLDGTSNMLFDINQLNQDRVIIVSKPEAVNLFAECYDAINKHRVDFFFKAGEEKHKQLVETGATGSR